MKKSVKKDLPYLPKNITMFSTRLADATFAELDDLFTNYGCCRSTFANELCGINNLENVTSFRTLRNDIRKQGRDEKLIKQYHFLRRHWVCALQDACANIYSMWSNLSNKINHAISNNVNFNDDERHYLRFVLCYAHLWLGVLQHNDDAYLDLAKKYQVLYLDVIKPLNDKQLQHANSYLRRVTRRYKMYPHKISKQNRSMTYDKSMYHFFDKRHMSFESAKSRETVKLELTSDWHYPTTGTVNIILDRDKHRIEIHKLIKSHKTPMKSKNDKVLGIDKGLYTLLSCSSGNEYGANFNKLANAEAERLDHKNGERHKNLVNGKTPTAKQYHKQKARHQAYIQSIINRVIKQMLLTEKPSLVVKEDLTFAEPKLPRAKNKLEAKRRRNMTVWCSGVLNRRLEYYCNKFGIPFVDVNPAYTSQYCPYCGRKFIARIGKHNEIAVCSNCGEMNANVVASINVKNRKDDPQITLYTPYKKVKEILDSRI